MAKTNPLISKVAKMLRLAADQEGTPEGDTAARMAYRLMREAGISEQEVAQADSDPDPISKHTLNVPASAWRRNLWAAVAKFCGCTIAYMRGTRILFVIGRTTDVEVCSYLVDSFINQLAVELKAWRLTNRSGSANNWRRSAVYGVSRRLIQLQTEARGEDQTGSAIILRRTADAERWMDDHMNVTEMKPAKYTHVHEAEEAGRRISLRAGVSSRNQNQLS